jgi:CBS domain-containing protein
MFKDIVVKEIMNKEPIFIHESRSVDEAVKIILDHKINGIAVVDEDQHVLGILTQGDLLLKATRSPFFRLWPYGDYTMTEELMEEYKKIIGTSVAEVMTRGPICIHEDELISRAAEIMHNERVKQLPVVHEERLVGMVTRSDIIKYIFAK